MRDDAGRITHWSEYKEATVTYLPSKLLLIMFKILPIIVLRILVFPIGFIFWIISGRGRTESRRYLDKIKAVLEDEKQGKKPPLNSLSHICSFALNVVEKVESWGGKVSLDRIHFQDDSINELRADLEAEKGVLLITSHLGNAELLRALAVSNQTGVSRDVPVNGIADFSVSTFFNRMLNELDPRSMLRLISVYDIGPETIILLQERLAAGELVVIAGDRTSANSRKKYFTIPFLKEDAPFAYGPFLLAALLNVPSYFVFGLRQKDISLSSQYDMHVHKMPVSFDCSRRERGGRMEEAARFYAGLLEGYCKQHPYQWYNIYNYWAELPPEE
jgi:predicted LPLAT superfamily acyltransferase